jgi:hypothetical protein
MRCAYAADQCAQARPPLALLSDRHAAACLRLDEIKDNTRN